MSYKWSVHPFSQNQEEFLKQCIAVTLESETHFESFSKYLEAKILKDNFKITTDETDTMHHFYKIILNALVNSENSEFLSKKLNYLKEQIKNGNQKFAPILNELKKNCPILMSACRKGNFELIKILVSHGCRFVISQWNPKQQVIFDTVLFL